MASRYAAVEAQIIPPGGSGVGSSRSAVLLRRLPLLVSLGVALAFYVWTASSNGNAVQVVQAIDFYNLQVDAYLDGHLSLPVRPPKELLALSNPYDPAANEPYRLHDASLYKGRYFMYWGPTPAATLFLPFRLLHIGELPPTLAAALYASGGLVFSVLLLSLLARRFFPDLPPWTMTVATLGLAFSNVAPFVLRRPAVYEIAISAGFFFAMAGFYFLARDLLAAESRHWPLALGSLLLGLAMGARVTMGLAAALVVAVTLAIRWRGMAHSDWMEKIRLVMSLAGPVMAIALLLLLYNKLRFDSWTDFGTQYVLAGVEMRKIDLFNLSYLAPNLFYYFPAWPKVDLDFPFAHLSPPAVYPAQLPPGYVGLEAVGGILVMVPIVALTVASWPLVRRRRRAGRHGAGVPIGLFAAVGVAVALLVSVTMPGATERYEMDFATPLLLAGFLTWFAMLGATRLRWAQTLVGIGGIVAVLWASVAGMAVSLTGYYDTLRSGNPRAYNSLEDTFEFAPRLVTGIIGRPVIVGITSAFGVVGGRSGYPLWLEEPSFSVGTDPVAMRIVAPDPAIVSLRGEFRRSARAGRAKRVVLRVKAAGASSRGRGYAVPDGVGNISVPIRAGVNRIQLRAVVDGHIGASPETATAIVDIDGLALATQAPTRDGQ